MVQPKEHTPWLHTSQGDPRGYIQPQKLSELWFHTGTTCNLSCSFCLEGSKPGDNRLNALTLDEIKPLILEAREYQVQRFSFTGGEPFMIPEMIDILDYALDHQPCFVLTNGTKPLLNRLKNIVPLSHKKNALSFRISIDFPDKDLHEQERGKGNFELAFQSLRQLSDAGFQISVARQIRKGDDNVEEKFREFFKRYGIAEDTETVAFPDFLTPGSIPEVPEITESCMTKYLTEEQRSAMMCNYSKMILKKDGKIRVYSCTLVDDDPAYDQGSSLKEAMEQRVMLKHHRCYSCFSFGASCSGTF